MESARTKPGSVQVLSVEFFKIFFTMALIQYPSELEVGLVSHLLMWLSVPACSATSVRHELIPARLAQMHLAVDAKPCSFRRSGADRTSKLADC
jgi:hypothetical protein